MFFVFLISLTLFYTESVLFYFNSTTERNLDYSTQYEKCIFCRMKYFLQESSILFPPLCPLSLSHSLHVSLILSLSLSFSLSFSPCLSLNLSISLPLSVSLPLSFSLSPSSVFFRLSLSYSFSPSSVFPLPFLSLLFLCPHAFIYFLFISSFSVSQLWVGCLINP